MYTPSDPLKNIFPQTLCMRISKKLSTLRSVKCGLPHSWKDAEIISLKRGGEKYSQQNWQESEDGKLLKYVFGMSLLSPEEVDECFLKLIALKPVDQFFDEFFDYFLQHCFSNYISTNYMGGLCAKLIMNN